MLRYATWLRPLHLASYRRASALLIRSLTATARSRVKHSIPKLAVIFESPARLRSNLRSRNWEA